MEKLTETTNPASNWSRILAYGIDSLVVSACSFCVYLEALLFQRSSGSFGYSLNLIVAVFLAYFFYHWLFLYFLGGTPGKLILGLRVHSKAENKQDPAGLGLFQSFLRVLADQLSIFFGHGLRALVLLRLDRTHVSDWVAETRVVQISTRAAPVKRHVFWAVALCLVFSCWGFMKTYHQFQLSSVVGNRLFFESLDRN